jgi:hypothetical protein
MKDAVLRNNHANPPQQIRKPRHVKKRPEINASRDGGCEDNLLLSGQTTAWSAACPQNP